MKVVFTGSQDGMTRVQADVVYQWLVQHDDIIEEIRHGGCIGADKEFHDFCQHFNLGELVEVYPSNIPSKQAVINPEAYKIKHPPDFPLERNKTMVYASEVCLATPKEADEVMRSGTWATIRYARKNHLKVVIIEPSGAINE
jgi:hypothetical protein